MANQPISEINSAQTSWNVKAKVIRLWVVSDFNRQTLPFSVEMILLDVEGGRIHATIKKTLIYKFRSEIREGNVYLFENMGVASNGGSYRTTHHPFKLNFQLSSRVVPLPNAKVTLSPYHFVPIREIVGGLYDTDFLVDVIGVLTGVGTEREVERNGTTTKLNVIALEASGHKIQCTLFGSYVDDLNTFMASGDLQNAVVIIQLAKVKLFQDNWHIQNCISCTRLVFNLTCDDGVMMRNRLIENTESPSPLTLTQLHAEPKVEPLEEFLYNTPRTTMQGLKDCSTESLFAVFVTVTHILNEENWWYTACVCNKSVYPDSKMYFCEKCNRHVTKVFPRYCIKVRVIDNSDCATFVLFDRDASLLFGKSCAEMLQSHDRTAGNGVLPAELSALVDTTILFKVETKSVFNPKFEQSFKVRKICTNEVVINEFKKKWDKEEATFSKNNNETNSLSALMDKGKDKIAASDANVLSQDLDSLSGYEAKGKEKIIEGACSGVSQGMPILFALKLSIKKSEYVLIKTFISSMKAVAFSQDLMTKFSLAGVEHDVDILPPIDSIITSVKKGSPNEEPDGGVEHDVEIFPPINSIITSVKRGSPNEEPDADINLPLKLLKRAIKIEKI